VPRRGPRVGGLTPQQVRARRARRWLRDGSGQQRVPAVLRGNSQRARAARALWDEKIRTSDEVDAAEWRYGVTSPQAVRARMRARALQEQIAVLVGESTEEIFARFSTRTQEGLDAIALMRY
jgi:hypothetical protein